MSEQKGFYERLGSAIHAIEALKKKSDNPFFKSKYVEISDMLAEVQPILKKFGLFAIQPSYVREDGRNVQCTFIRDMYSDQYSMSELAMPDLPDPQKVVGATTYFRRGTLQNELALQAVDDDGNSMPGTKASGAAGNKPGGKQSSKRNNDF